MVLVRIHDGVLKKGRKVSLMRSKKEYQIEQVGILNPKPKIVDSLSAGEVGFITAAIKSVSDAIDVILLKFILFITISKEPIKYHR